MDQPTLLVTLTGPDRPGVTSTLFDRISAVGAEVIDLEQVVLRGQLTLAVLLAVDGVEPQLRQVVHETGTGLGMQVQVHSGRGDNRSRPTGRAAVAVLGAPITATHLAAVSKAIAEHGANIDRIRRLSRFPVTTIELDVSGADLLRLRRELALVSSEHKVDIAVARSGLARRGRRLVVMDVDSTLIHEEVIELLARHAGREHDVAEVTARAMRGEIDFAESLHERVATLAGLPVSALDDVRRSITLTPGARTLIRTLRRLGFSIALVSGGFIEVVADVADELGIPHARANRLGDGANDLDMLEAAGLGIAFNAKPLVRAQADTAVNVPYLDAVLYLLGISREEVEEADAADPTTAPMSLPAIPASL